MGRSRRVTQQVSLGLVWLVGSLGLGAVAPRPVAAQAIQGYVYYLPVLANLHGANGSLWRTLVRLRALSGQPTHFTIQAHPRGAQAQAGDPTSGTTTICGTCSASFDNVLANMVDGGGHSLGLTGAYWGEIRSDRPLGVDSSTTANLAADGSSQGSDVPTLDAATVWSDPALARRGDVIEFPLDGTPSTRENLILFGVPTSTTSYGGPTIRVDTSLLDSHGNPVDGATVTLTPGTYLQFSPIAPALTNGKGLAPGDVLRLRLGADGGSGEFLLYAVKSEVDNVVQTSQDPSSKSGYVEPLVNAVFNAAVGVEVGAPAVFSATFAVRGGGYASAASFNERGVCDAEGNCNSDFSATNGAKANPWTVTHVTTAGTAGSFTPLLDVQVVGDDGATYRRELRGAPYTVAQPSIGTAQRASAATATAQSATNACAAIQPFYWEIGDAQQALASGSVNAPGGGSTPTYTASSLMSIASASKWLYAAYVVQREHGQLSDSDVKFLTFRSGYTKFSTCLPGQTVDGCVGYLNNGVHDAATDGAFYYNGGHMEKHADLLGLGPLANGALASEIQSQIGSDIAFTYSQPQLAGGVVTNAENYARFLRKLLNGTLLIGSMLSADAVCTNPTTCPAGEAIYTPVPASESWHYGIGHWIEDDPAVGDGAFSSPGAFGFYPWIDASRTWYGIVARVTSAGYYESAQCGRAIRKAWVTGVAQ
ncbi:MAG TPA: hypothetical protein VLW17_11135 [Thermoanaerobaculaceae bacterium]|nr:hypothetical protein [Thermoanaerobaculaceae bacterium]